MALAESLREVGLDVWTPIETVRLEPPRLEPWEKPTYRHRRRQPDIITRPMLPTFVFARFVHLAELLALSHSPSLQYRIWDADKRRMVTKGHPRFRLFDPDARPICDREFADLRKIESRRRKPRGKVVAFMPGDRVRLTDGAYEGLRGTVVRTEGKLAVVNFGVGQFEPKIQTWLLKPDLDESGEIQQKGPQSERGGEAA